MFGTNKIAADEISSRSLRRRNFYSKTSKTMCLFTMDGQITFITWDLRMITGPFVMEVSLQEDWDFEKDNNHASLQQLILWLEQ